MAYQAQINAQHLVAKQQAALADLAAAQGKHKQLFNFRNWK